MLTAVTHATQRPAFRAQTELVRIDVLAERNGRPIEGLTAADFTVDDNGVRQSVQLLPASGVTAVATVLDVSGSMTPEKLKKAGAGVQALVAALHERDRYTFYAVAGDPRRIPLPESRLSLSSESIAGALRETSGVHTPLVDALFAAVLENAAEDGPKLLVVLTDGRNNTSWLSAESAVNAATRHETAIYSLSVGDDAPQHPFDQPPISGDAALRLLQILADRTGGRLIHANWSKDLAPMFAAIVREYRQRYILAFSPEGVARGDGWHRLEVRLRTRPGRVHARSGYWSR
jgi:VWFA-related protein